jgi:protein tyrosine phosphatase
LEKPKPTDWAHKEENVPKNRFADAVPCNFNRVILQPMIGYDNTYYNASLIKVRIGIIRILIIINSFVQGYFYPYILAQDPLGPETAFEFWRMVNDQQTYTIVMLSTEQDFLPHEMVCFFVFHLFI